MEALAIAWAAAGPSVKREKRAYEEYGQTGLGAQQQLLPPMAWGLPSCCGRTCCYGLTLARSAAAAAACTLHLPDLPLPPVLYSLLLLTQLSLRLLLLACCQALPLDLLLLRYKRLLLSTLLMLL